MAFQDSDRNYTINKGGMGVVTALATSLLLMMTSSAGSSVEPSVCRIPACFCTHSAATVHRVVYPDIFQVTCFVQSVSRYDPTLRQLTSDVTSLKLTCSDSLTQNSLTSQSFSHLPNLRQLGLENCRFAAVSYDALSSVPNLHVLEVTRCVFTELPDQLFNATGKLSRLTLAHCDLHTLPQLCSQRSLELLNVSGQSLTSLDESVEGCASDRGLKELGILDVSRNNLSDMPHSVLRRAIDLKELYVQDNQISELSFTGCVKIEVLHVLGQQLERANFTPQSCVLNLRDLRLEANGSVLFPVHHLQRMPGLTILHLENMALNDELWEVLPSLKNLSQLSLPGNNLTSINLTNEISLVHLNLSRNAITDLESDTFSWHKDLAVIDLSWNKVTKLRGGMFFNLTSLHTLNLQHNQLVMVFQRALSSLPSLQNLNLDNNQLNTLPLHLLREMRALKVLTVNYNNMSILPFMKKATELVLVGANYNQLSAVPIFSDVPNLEYIFLRGNKLRHVNSAAFLNAPILAFLDLSENVISSLDSFRSHPNLRWIRLENNFIRDVSLVLRGMPQLAVVFLDNNRLTRLTSVMFPSSLRALSVSWNRIGYVESRMFVGMPSLTTVNMGGNSRLWRLPWSSVQISPSLSPKPAFTVAPNTFVCDCEMAYLKAWALTTATGDPNPKLRASLPDFPNLQFLECLNGENYALFNDVPLSDFVCPFENVLCDDSCPCCSTPSQQPHTNCTCRLTCPHACACFHGGSRHVQLYTHVVCRQRNLTEVPDLIPARATHVRLDGNRLTVLGNDTLRHVTAVMVLYLNASEVKVLEQGCFLGLDVLQVLDLSDNEVARIEEDTFGQLPALEELDLQRNRIRFLHHAAFTQLDVLKVLYLNDNWLKRVDSFDAFPSTAAFSLAGNPWSCDCDFVADFLKFLISHRENVLDYSSLRCFPNDTESVSVPVLTSNGTFLYDNDSSSKGGDALQSYQNQSGVLLSEFEFSQHCSNSSLPTVLPPDRGSHPGHLSAMMTPALISILVVVLLAVVVGVIIVRWRAEIKAWIYVRLNIRLWDKAVRLDRHFAEAVTKNNGLQPTTAGGTGRLHPKLYDAFVSYSHHDEDFVVNTLVPRLEQQGPRRYRLCLHYRDFPVGDCIADTIMESVENSQRTILLLSRHFLDSEWCRFEFRTAHQHVLRQGGHRLVMILMEDLEEQRLDPDLKMAMKTRTYLTTKDPWFWEKLYFAMPDLPCCGLHDNQQGTQLPAPDHSPEAQDGVEFQGNAPDPERDQALETLETAVP